MSPPTSWLRRHGETVIAPVFIVLIYVGLVLSTEAALAADIVTAIVFAIILGIYVTFRRLRVHATATRLASIGDPDALLAHIERELPRRLVRSARLPLHVFRAMAFDQRGDWARARAALDAAEAANRAPAPGWRLLWAAADIHTRTGAGDPAGARRTFDTVVTPLRPKLSPRTFEPALRECEARVRLAEGDAAGARELVAPMLKDIRLGAGARAQLHTLFAAAADADGDAATAAEHVARARTLAPKCQPTGAAAA